MSWTYSSALGQVDRPWLEGNNRLLERPGLWVKFYSRSNFLLRRGPGGRLGLRAVFSLSQVAISWTRFKLILRTPGPEQNSSPEKSNLFALSQSFEGGGGQMLQLQCPSQGRQAVLWLQLLDFGAGSDRKRQLRRDSICSVPHEAVSGQMGQAAGSRELIEETSSRYIQASQTLSGFEWNRPIEFTVMVRDYSHTRSDEPEWWRLHSLQISIVAAAAGSIWTTGDTFWIGVESGWNCGIHSNVSVCRVGCGRQDFLNFNWECPFAMDNPNTMFRFFDLKLRFSFRVHGKYGRLKCYVIHGWSKGSGTWTFIDLCTNQAGRWMASFG